MDLKSWLKREGLSQQAFADDTGLSQQTISKVSNGHIPSPEIAKKIVGATNGEVTLNDLFGLAPAPSGEGAAGTADVPAPSTPRAAE